MAKSYGVKTKSIAEHLKQKLLSDAERFRGIEVFYDHGDSSNPGVVRSTTYMGRRYGRDATLSAVDIVIAKRKKVILAIEIEEGIVRPKEIIGDVFGIALADRIRIRRKPYSIRNATIIIAIAESGKRKQSVKYIRLERHLNRYFETIPSKTLKKVRIITCPTHDLIRRIERLIRLETGKRI
jgi:hypothetical protein